MPPSAVRLCTADQPRPVTARKSPGPRVLSLARPHCAWRLWRPCRARTFVRDTKVYAPTTTAARTDRGDDVPRETSALTTVDHRRFTLLENASLPRQHRRLRGAKPTLATWRTTAVIFTFEGDDLGAITHGDVPLRWAALLHPCGPVSRETSARQQTRVRPSLRRRPHMRRMRPHARTGVLPGVITSIFPRV